jgi:hypothetical protein
MIIGVFGLIGSGKNTVSDFLATEHNFKQLSWAASLKDAVAPIFNWNRELLEGLTPEARVWREQPDQWWSKRLGRTISPRIVLQEWGTDVCRNNFHQEIWIASLENKIRNESSNIVISDCRFANEQAAIKRLGGINIRVVRDPEPVWVSLVKTNFDLFRIKYPEIHASEYSSIDLKYDHIIHNNGSIDELKEKITSLVGCPPDAS